jgi:amino acid transporter
MNTGNRQGWLRSLFIGKARDLSDKTLFHKVSLVAVLAWVGLGADGLSSSCYGPEETFKALGAHAALAPFIALASMITIAIICLSYSQIIELFPGGGGGYLVASKLLSPSIGVVSGCALLVDYVLTIAISIASGADALFSVFPASWLTWKLPFAAVAVALLTLLNLRGVKESVLLWVPVFFVFVGTYGFGIGYALTTHLGMFPEVMARTGADLRAAHSELGWLGLFLILVRAYSVGAGTYTGIEAVSNGLPILREPRVATGKRTMLYMGISLALTVGGLLLAYLLYRVMPQEGKTLNAVLFETMTASWPASLGTTFVWIAMLSAAALLLIAAQAGFLDGPRVLANMALDRWFPSRFAMLSDRFVAQNGILLMGGAALLVLLLTRGAVGLLVVLYSINVFITFSLSQLGMVRHWWQERRVAPHWKKKLTINSIGFGLTAFILVMLIVTKFSEGGWITVLVTSAFVVIAFLTHRHYRNTSRELARLDLLVPALSTDPAADKSTHPTPIPCDPAARTAVIFVNGFNGLGVHTVLCITRMFPHVFRNFIFVQIGLVDAGNFKGAGELENLRQHIGTDVARYADYMRAQNFHAETITEVGHDVVETAHEVAAGIVQRFPQAVFFGGQLVFVRESRLTRLLHNFTVFTLQRKFFRQGIPFVVVPVRL